MVGSAFDPSTVMVALKLKSERPRHVRPEAARPGRKLPPPIPMEAGYGLIQPVPAALQRGLAARAEAEIPPHIAPPHSDTIRVASLARAPPAA